MSHLIPSLFRHIAVESFRQPIILDHTQAAKRNPRFHFHFTPTSASWLNMVERFFRDLTERSLRRGVFRNLLELTTAIEDHISAHNSNPKPLVWTATARDILEKVKRGRRKLDKTQAV
jgi:DDE superfamily endonuclease